MTPLTQNPTVVILLNKNAAGLIEATATNVASNLEVKIVTTLIDFINESTNKPFNSLTPVVSEQVMSMAGSKARYATK